MNLNTISLPRYARPKRSAVCNNLPTGLRFWQLHLLQVQLTTSNRISNEQLLNREFLKDQDQGVGLYIVPLFQGTELCTWPQKTRPQWRARFWTWTMWPEWTSTHQYSNPDGWCTDGFHFFIPTLTRLVSTGWFFFLLLNHDPLFFLVWTSFPPTPT